MPGIQHSYLIHIQVVPNILQCILECFNYYRSLRKLQFTRWTLLDASPEKNFCRPKKSITHNQNQFDINNFKGKSWVKIKLKTFSWPNCYFLKGLSSFTNLFFLHEYHDLPDPSSLIRVISKLLERGLVGFFSALRSGNSDCNASVSWSALRP